jgi:hypothetical protein
MTEQPPAPAEQLPISLFDAVVLAVRDTDGLISLAITDVCQSLSIDESTQRRRLRAHSLLSQAVRTYQVQTPGGPQAQAFLELEKVPTWLLMINQARVGASARPRLRWFQEYTIRAVYRAFAELGGLPEGGSRAIEDLADLQRVNRVLTTIVERTESVESRQESLEGSQERARDAWRALRDEIRAVQARVDAIERHMSSRIDTRQQGYLYQLVQAWGTALAEHMPQLTRKAAHATCWAAFKRTFVLASYEDLPAERYNEAVAYIQVEYRKLTGQELHLPEQQGLGLE